MANSVKVAEEYAEEIVRSKLQAAGWVAGMFTVSIMVWDAISNALEGRLKLAGADLVKAVGVGVMTNSDIIAGRILTPMGRQLVHRTGERAVSTALLTRAATAVGWGGTVSGAWVTGIGLGIYGLGQWFYYEIKDDAVSKWLRAGPFTGKVSAEQPELMEEKGAYIGLVKSMMPVSITQVTGRALDEILPKQNLSKWLGATESVFSFSTPALVVSGKPVSIKLELSFERTHYEVVTPHVGKVAIESKNGSINAITHKFDDDHTIHFVVAEFQLPEMIPNENGRYVEYVSTHYTLKNLELTFEVEVWDRQQKAYEIQEVTEKFTDLKIKKYAND